jgi:hypothetical protein
VYRMVISSVNMRRTQETKLQLTEIRMTMIDDDDKRISVAAGAARRLRKMNEGSRSILRLLTNLKKYTKT